MSNLRKKLADKTSKLGISEKTIDHPAKINHLNGDFKIIPLKIIKPDPNQPRKVFDTDKMEELTNTVLQHGVLQPIIVRVGDTEDDVWLIAGERRYRAALKAGLTEIPAIISKGNPAEIALIENVQREDLNPIEEANSYKRMIDDFKYTQEQLAMIVGKGRSTITEILSLNNLSEDIKTECLSLNIPKRNLIELAKINNSKKLISLFNKLKKGLINREDIKKQSTKTIKLKDKIISKLKRTLNEMEKADLDSLIDQDKIDILDAFGELSVFIEKKFSPIDDQNT